MLKFGTRFDTSFKTNYFLLTKQTQFYERALQLAMDQYAVIPLYQNSYTMMIHPNITGLQVESNLLHDIRSKWINKH